MGGRLEVHTTALTQAAGDDVKLDATGIVGVRRADVTHVFSCGDVAAIYRTSYQSSL